MSLNEAVKNYIEGNPTITKTSFIKVMDDIFVEAKKNIKKDEVEFKSRGGFKGALKVVEKKLNPYQQFLKEQMVILQDRESKKEVKKKPRELMAEIAEMWKNNKA